MFFSTIFLVMDTLFEFSILWILRSTKSFKKCCCTNLTLPSQGNFLEMWISIEPLTNFWRFSQTLRSHMTQDQMPGTFCTWSETVCTEINILQPNSTRVRLVKALLFGTAYCLRFWNLKNGLSPVKIWCLLVVKNGRWRSRSQLPKNT